MNKKAEVLLKATENLGTGSVVVECGSLRFDTEIATDGFSTYHLAQRAKERGWIFYTVDQDQKAMAVTQRVLGNVGLLQYAVIVEAEASKWLDTFADKIDCLYLDMSAVANARAVQAAYDKLTNLVVIDDTNATQEGEFGEGSLAIPWLDVRGWDVISYPTEMQSNGINPMLMSCLTRKVSKEKPVPIFRPKVTKEPEVMLNQEEKEDTELPEEPIS